MPRRLLILLLLLLVCSFPSLARERTFGYCYNQINGVPGPQTISTQCTVTVFLAGTNTQAVIFSDNNGTVQSNSFQSDTNGFWFFYADNGRYDVQYSGGNPGINPYTTADVLVEDPYAGGGVAAKPFPSDAIQYVSSNGSDNNDGLSMGTAKLTNAAACSALPSGNSGCTAGSGVVWIMPGFTGTVITPSSASMIVMDWRSGTLVIRGPSSAVINLSNGSSGSGAVVLGTSPTIASPTIASPTTTGTDTGTETLQNKSLNGFACSGIQSYSSAHTLTNTDCWANVTGTTTITAPHALTGQRWHLQNTGVSVVTVTPDNGTINGSSSLPLPPGDGIELTCDGTNCFAGVQTVAGFGVPVSLATQAGLTNAIAAAVTLGSCVIIPPATTISISSSVSWNNNNACLIGAGPTSLLSITGSTSFNAISFAGTGLGSSSSLNSNSAEGTNQVALVTGSVSALGLNVGDYIEISDAQATPSKEVTRVSAIATDTLTTADPMYEAFTTANTAKVQKMVGLDGVRVSNLRIDYSGNTGANTTALYLQYATNADLSEITVTGAQNSAFAVQMDTGYHNTVRNIRLIKTCSTSNFNDFNMWTQTGALVRDLYSSESGCFGPGFAWVNGSNIQNVTVIRANYRGFKTSRASWNNFSNLQVHYSSIASAGTYTGILFSAVSRRNTLTNFEATNDGAVGLEFGDTSSNNLVSNGNIAFNTNDILFDVGNANNIVINTSFSTVVDNSGTSSNSASNAGTLPHNVSCGNTTTCSNTNVARTQIVNGTISLSTGTATITGINNFTSTGSYFCQGTDKTALNAVRIQNISASSITITGTGSDVIDYICTGN